MLHMLVLQLKPQLILPYLNSKHDLTIYSSVNLSIHQSIYLSIHPCEGYEVVIVNNCNSQSLLKRSV